MRNDVKWFCENAHSLEKFSGRCVVFHPENGVVKVLTSLLTKNDSREKPFLFHVPSKKELDSPVVVALKK